MAPEPEISGRLVMQPATSSYPSLGVAYDRSRYSIEYLERLVRTGKNYRDSKSRIIEGRMSTAAEELAIQRDLERAGTDPRQAEQFKDLFGKNASHWYAWQWTETGLRVPKGHDSTKYEYHQGRKHWAREVLIGKDVVGEVLVPEGNNRVVVEWDEVFGLPRATENIDFPHTPHTTHFWFNENPNKDSVSGHQDVAVGRRSLWRPDGAESCLSVDAAYARSSAVSAAGFRLVRV